MIHMYTGDGKGKTTAAVGLAVRMAGCGKPVLFCRFLKNRASGELAALQQLAEITVLDCGEVQGFVPQMEERERERVSRQQAQAFSRACAQVLSGRYALAVMDEALWLPELGILPAEELTALLETLPSGVELVLTGGSPENPLLDRADYVTEMRKRRHPFDRGVGARRGIEF